MKTKTVIVAVTALLIGYILFQEFGAVPEVQKNSLVIALSPDMVAEVEEEQISRELVAQSKRSRLSKEYILKCAPCHNRDGYGPIGASIAGMSKDELIKTLMAYKMGERKNTLMENLMKNIHDDEINRLADEISGF